MTKSVPPIWVTHYRFVVDGAVTKIAFGESGENPFVAVALPTNLVVDLLSRLGAVVRDQIVAEATQAQPAADVAEAPDAVSRH